MTTSKMIFTGALLAALVITAPAAYAAPNDASYSAENLVDPSEAARTGAVPSASGAGGEAPSSADSLRCWDASLSGSTFAISCSGNNFYTWVDCSNGSRYTGGPFSGSYRSVLACPGGSRALEGGAYGS
ncbi:hypothetical protein [Streptomyces candidus]|uniref:Uncharacterized protein n=1 Tax=Streptomyces candidus TaxID=67283 RepID=A0A7X0LSX9_9ACTN|nr:hypothetical protein [Streptomyces candidus]MBB6439710.1 hypothetical protein [Streptomyces candidus]GHH45821.1 hypothetical protein GCM10018773_36020 [Streptomyces candidus]